MVAQPRSAAADPPAGAAARPGRVLICGAGIAGTTLAYWLARYGMRPTIVERAPTLRTAGYVIDFWGAGFDIAERMGLLPELARLGYHVREVRVVDGRGHKRAGFPVDAFSRITAGRFVSVPRGDLAAAIFRALDDRVETLFGDTIDRVAQHDGGVTVSFGGGAVREFDLVVGADGLHSRVRELLWGPERQFERYLGLKAAAFEVAGYRPRDELVYVMYTEVGRQVARFALRDDRTMFLFTFADAGEHPIAGAGLEANKEALRSRFAGSGWECPRILGALDAASDLYFDRVSQIRIGGAAGAWSRGRVTLVGDAASCVSLLGGQGAALAMTAAYLLAGEIHRAGADHARALARYEERFRPFVERKQNVAIRFASVFAPPSTFRLAIRNQVMRLMALPGVTNLIAGREFVDRIELPSY